MIENDLQTLLEDHEGTPIGQCVSEIAEYLYTLVHSEGGVADSSIAALREDIRDTTEQLRDIALSLRQMMNDIHAYVERNGTV